MAGAAIAFAAAPATAETATPAAASVAVETVAVETAPVTATDDMRAEGGWEFVDHYSTYITCAADGAWYVVFFNDIDDWECTKNPGGTYYQLWVHSTDCTCTRSENVAEN